MPHYGSTKALNEDLVAEMNPNLAIISVEAGNRFGYPAQETLMLLEQAGVQVLRTDQVGTIEVVTDGEQYWVRAGNLRWCTSSK